MFTGIIQHVGTVAGVRPGQDSRRLTIDLGPLAGGPGADGAALGDSIAVDGVCLTVAALDGPRAEMDVGAETLRRTTLGGLGTGSRVNLEPALRVGDRLGGHFVSGHVDGVGTINRLQEMPGEWRLEVAVEPELTDQMIMKGSVAVAGISLTIAALRPDAFEVSVIPHTLQETTLRDAQTGTPVNIECDMIGRWVRKHLGAAAPGASSSLSIQDLEEGGF
jgi:riboflavin synthase